MYPRPIARGKPLEVPDAEDMAEEIRLLRVDRQEPAAILSGPREWSKFKQQPGARGHHQVWPAGEETFCLVPVIIRMGLGGAKLMLTQSDVEEVLLP